MADLYMSFIDFGKVFESVDRDVTSQLTYHNGIPRKLNAFFL